MTQGTSSAKIHCPNTVCQKPILTHVALAEGTRFVMKCAGCGKFVRIITGFNTIEKRLVDSPRDHVVITPDEQEPKG